MNFNQLYSNFKQLHTNSKPLVICNVWDVKSAQVAEKLGYTAIGTSSAAIASSLGYEDGESMSFNELLYVVKRVLSSVKSPLTVDIESGFAETEDELFNNIATLAKEGVVGVNIEDSKVANGVRTLVDKFEFATLLKAVKMRLNDSDIDMFFNIRTDTYLLNLENKEAETLARIQQYSDAGADGIFIPCIEAPEDIERVVQQSNLPINVMCMPNLPEFAELESLGVKRISMGNFLFEKQSELLEQEFTRIIKTQSFKSVF